MFIEANSPAMSGRKNVSRNQLAPVVNKLKPKTSPAKSLELSLNRKVVTKPLKIQVEANECLDLKDDRKLPIATQSNPINQKPAQPKLIEN